MSDERDQARAAFAAQMQSAAAAFIEVARQIAETLEQASQERKDRG